MRGWLQQAAGGLPRTFWLLWTGTLINRVGSFVVIFLAIYLTGDRGFSQSRAGLVIGLYGVGGALGTVVGGVLSDRWGRRPTMLTAQFTAAGLMLVLGFAHTYWQILAVTPLLGFCTEAVRPAFAAMMVDVVPDPDRVRAYSLNYWAINLGFALSAIGAGLAAKAGYLLLFLVDAGSTLATATLTLILLPETRPARERGGPARPAPAGGFSTVLRDRVYLTYLLISFGVVLVMMQHMSTLPIAMTADGHSAATYGWVIAVNGVLIVLGQLFVPKLIDGYDRSRVLALSALIIGVGFGLVAFAEPAWFFALTVVIWTAGEMLQAPSNAATIAALSPAALRGRYQGFSALSWSAGTALAPVAGGLTQEHLGDAVLWVGSFGVCVLVAVGHLVTGPSRERRITHLRTEPATAPRPAEPPRPVPPSVAEPLADDPINAR